MDATMSNYQQMLEDYRRIEQAINLLAASRTRQPSLREVAESLALSEYHFQRLFTRWVGISPKRFLQYLTKEYAKALLEESHNVLEVSYQAGLSGPGRLHDLFVTCESVTPGEFKRRGEQYDRSLGFKRPEVRAWFQTAGLEQVTLDCLSENCCAASGDHAQVASVSIFIACGVKGLASD